MEDLEPGILFFIYFTLELLDTKSDRLQYLSFRIDITLQIPTHFLCFSQLCDRKKTNICLEMMGPSDRFVILKFISLHNGKYKTEVTQYVFK